jgi:hypothetical protein
MKRSKKEDKKKRYIYLNVCFHVLFSLPSSTPYSLEKTFLRVALYNSLDEESDTNDKVKLDV